MSAIVQVTSFRSSEEYIRLHKHDGDGASLDKAKAEMARKSCTEQGCLGVFHGLRIEDSTTGYLMTAWDSLDKLRASRDASAFVDSMTGGARTSQQTFVVAGEHPLPALHSPVTELVVLTPHNDADGPRVLASMGVVASELHKVGAESAWGPCVEEPQVCGMVCGWESMEVHQKTVGKPPFSSLIGSIAEVADIGYGHCKLMKVA
ncbi:hypothetical protein HDZ31DRAFT_45432 [Schizophyllum fasciatum]